MTRSACCVLVVALIAIAPRFPAPPPIPSERAVAETMYGTSVTDPYRYFENMDDPVVQQFFRDQNAYTRAVLDRLDGAREQLLHRIAQLDNADVPVRSVSRAGPYYFYEKLNPGENSLRLYVRRVDGGEERILVNPERFAKPGQHYTIDYYLPSLDGSKVAYGISEGGSEAEVIHVVDTATGQIRPDAIDRAYYFGATSWLPGSNEFYYVRFPKMQPGEALTDKETRAVAYLHVLGRDPDEDVAVFGYGINPKVPFGLTDFPIVSYSPVSPYITVSVANGVKNERTIYATRADRIDSPNVTWTKVASESDDVVGYEVRGSTIYLLTHNNAPTYKIVATSLDAPDVASARSVVPASKSVIVDLDIASNGLYVLSHDGGFSKITHVAIADDGTAGATTTVALPYRGSVNAMVTDARQPGAVFGLTGWTHQLLIYAAGANGAVADTHLKPPANVDTAPYTSSEVTARSADGTMVPLSIMYKKGIERDGSHPAYLQGYGAYGITLNPSFSATRIAWLERGGVFAVCHPRGGGWFGEAWHRAGMIATKPHTWEDFIACGRWLINNRYTSPAHLAGEGTSAGGITIGRSITAQPHLFAAALDVVGVSNALRSEFTPNGPPNIPEFRSVKTEAGFRALYAMDAYEHVVPGTAYPAVMSITGYNDPRVASWELAKFTARLARATTSGRPILLRVDYDAGHGFRGATRQQSEQLLTDEYAFLLWQCGDPAFAGIPTRIYPRQSAER